MGVKARGETSNLPHLYTVCPSLSPVSDKNNILYYASCHTGARLFWFPGVSLALHPICRVLAMTGQSALRKPSCKIGPYTLPAAPALSACRTPRGSPSLAPGRSTKPPACTNISSFLSLPHPFFHSLQGFSVVLPFLAISQTGSGLHYDICV